MKNVLLALVVLVLTAGFASATGVGATDPACPDCWANVITQTDVQTINDVDVGCEGTIDPLIYNEAGSAAVIYTPAFDATNIEKGNIVDSFARVDQGVTQTLNDVDIGALAGKTTVYNTAVQAAWIEGQGRKELFPPKLEMSMDNPEWYQEAAYVKQSTTQTVNAATIGWTLGANAGAPTTIYNADDKLAIITNSLGALGIERDANMDASDTHASSATVN
jgi:hypothetical protein